MRGVALPIIELVLIAYLARSGSKFALSHCCYASVTVDLNRSSMRMGKSRARTPVA